MKALRDKAEAMRAYAKQAKDVDMANLAAEIRIRAERKLGLMLKAQKEAGGMNTGTAGQLTGERDSTGGRTVKPPVNTTPTLSDMSITKSMSSRAQAIASVPEDEFESVISEYREKQKELTSNMVRRLIKKQKKQAREDAKNIECDSSVEIIHTDFRIADALGVEQQTVSYWFNRGASNTNFCNGSTPHASAKLSAEIGVRALRRLGEISKELEKSKGGSNPEATLPTAGKSKNEVLKAAGVSTSTANRCEKLAEIPAKEFEAYITKKCLHNRHWMAVVTVNLDSGLCNEEKYCERKKYAGSSGRYPPGR